LALTQLPLHRIAMKVVAEAAAVVETESKEAENAEATGAATLSGPVMPAWPVGGG